RREDRPGPQNSPLAHALSPLRGRVGSAPQQRMRPLVSEPQELVVGGELAGGGGGGGGGGGRSVGCDASRYQPWLPPVAYGCWGPWLWPWVIWAAWGWAQRMASWTDTRWSPSESALPCSMPWSTSRPVQTDSCQAWFS